MAWTLYRAGARLAHPGPPHIGGTAHTVAMIILEYLNIVLKSYENLFRMGDVYFARPEWLWLMALVPPLGVWVAWGGRRRLRDWSALGQGGRPWGDGAA